jgi:hydroxyacylglutathione hydrolase
MDIIPIAAFSDNYIWAICTEKEHIIIVDPGDADVVERFLEAHEKTLAAILITHHHGDHTGGLLALKARHHCPVYGPDNQDIVGIDHIVSEGLLEIGGLQFEVFPVPGHTLDHIVYYCPKEALLFCGDTLFAGGCGRVFEGTYAQMQASLARLRALPASTSVFCAHEYTLANLAFAVTVEPDNQALHNRLAHCKALRAAHKPTVPTTIGAERETNPFMRWDAPNIQARLKQEGILGSGNAEDVFTVLRQWKDSF